jgi:hypothetical protein
MLRGSWQDAVRRRCRDHRLGKAGPPESVPGPHLPERFGHWKNVHRLFSRWAESGVREKIFEHIAADGGNEYAFIDNTIVRLHQHSAGAKKSPQPGERKRETPNMRVNRI